MGNPRYSHLQTPFGEGMIEANGIVNVPVKFPGQYADAESGFNDNWNRTYDPALGRYIQSDPIGLMGGINTFVYVDGNPVMRTDPEGLDWGISGAIGGIAGSGSYGGLSGGVSSGKSNPDMKPCPSVVVQCRNNPNWSRYPERSGEIMFHCGFECYNENTPNRPRNQCCYDPDGSISTGNCQGTPDYFSCDDGKMSCFSHTVIDPGGVFKSGPRGALCMPWRWRLIFISITY